MCRSQTWRKPNACHKHPDEVSDQQEHGRKFKQLLQTSNQLITFLILFFIHIILSSTACSIKMDIKQHVRWNNEDFICIDASERKKIHFADSHDLMDNMFFFLC